LTLKPIFEMPMQPSPYLKVYPCAEKPGHVLLFSTKKASKIILKQETFESLGNGNLSSSDENLLSNLGMIVDDRQAEQDAVLGFMDKVNAKSTGLSLMVVLNLDCNFACTYCYEGDMKGKHYMSADTADRLIDFIKERLTEDKKSLIVDFYGGEPLLSAGLIKHISQALKSVAENKGATYDFTLVTNGSLFTRQVAQALVPLGLKSVKITLDGPAEIHNRYRPFTSGAGSFNTIIKNIKETWDLVKIGIGGNFERGNYGEFVALLDYLAKEGLTPDKIPMVKFDPVMNGSEHDTLPTAYTGGCTSINEPWIGEAAAFLREEILKRGYNTLKIAPMTCMVERADSYVVNFDGGIYKCPGFLGKKGFEVGDVRTGVMDYASTYKLGNWKNEACMACEYLPLCFGGCRYMSYIRDGNTDTVDCQKAYLDASLETLINQDIRYGLKADSH
jgi:uncharacterized protein